MSDEAMQIWEQAHWAWYRAPGSVLDPEGNANKAAAAVIAEALAARDARIAELERAVIKAAAPDFLTQAEREALKDFVDFLRSSDGSETRQELETKHD